MTMRKEIKGLIEAILNTELSGVEDAVNLACDKVDEIFDHIEETVSKMEDDIFDDDNIELIGDSLKKLHNDL